MFRRTVIFNIRTIIVRLHNKKLRNLCLKSAVSIGPGPDQNCHKCMNLHEPAGTSLAVLWSNQIPIKSTNFVLEYEEKTLIGRFPFFSEGIFMPVRLDSIIIDFSGVKCPFTMITIHSWSFLGDNITYFWVFWGKFYRNVIEIDWKLLMSNQV